MILNYIVNLLLNKWKHIKRVTKEDLFDKIIHDALNKVGAPIMNRWKRISLLIVLHLFLV